MLKGAGKSNELMYKLFIHFFAVFHEDAPEPVSSFSEMAPMLPNKALEIKARLSVASCLGTVLKFHLIKVFAARSEPGGFLTAKSVDFGSFENYDARQLHVDVRHAQEGGQKPPDVWLAHSGSIVKKNMAMAMKSDSLSIKKSVTGPGTSISWSYTGSFDSSAID